MRIDPAAQGKLSVDVTKRGEPFPSLPYASNGSDFYTLLFYAYFYSIPNLITSFCLSAGLLSVGGLAGVCAAAFIIAVFLCCCIFFGFNRRRKGSEENCL